MKELKKQRNSENNEFLDYNKQFLIFKFHRYNKKKETV